MKIDPATGMAYSKDWERDLNLIHQAGFSCGYIQIVDLATGRNCWQVDAIRGEGPRVVIEKLTLPEAMKELRLYGLELFGSVAGQEKTC